MAIEECPDDLRLLALRALAGPFPAMRLHMTHSTPPGPTTAVPANLGILVNGRGPRPEYGGSTILRGSSS